MGNSPSIGMNPSKWSCRDFQASVRVTRRNDQSPSPRSIGKCHSEQSIWAFDAHRRTLFEGFRMIGISLLGTFFVVRTFPFSCPRYPSDIHVYAEQKKEEIRTRVLTITKLTLKRCAKHELTWIVVLRWKFCWKFWPYCFSKFEVCPFLESITSTTKLYRNRF